jgi:moderate conductance mechanosensitive channel
VPSTVGPRLRSTVLPMMLAEPGCAAEAGSWCQRVWDWTGVAWLSVATQFVLVPLLHILLIVGIGLLARMLLHRAIDRMTRITVGGVPVPKSLMPWRDKLDENLIGTSMITRRLERSQAIAALLKSVSSFVIVIVCLILILSELGINIAPILASAGIAGVALGFGAQNLVRDFLSGIAMILEDQCGVGDSVDLGQASGVVIGMGLRTTTVRGGNGTVWHVRNGEILRVGNVSQGEALVEIDITVPARVDSMRAADLALAAAREVAGTEEFADIATEPELGGMAAMTHDAETLRITSTVQVGKQAAFERAVRMAAKGAIDRAGLME